MAITTIKEAYQSALTYLKRQTVIDTQEINRAWFSRTGAEANKRIIALEGKKRNAQNVIASFGKSAYSESGEWSSQTLTKRFKEQKEYAALLAELTKSYIFVEKVRVDITKQETSYLLNLYGNVDTKKGTKFINTIQKVTLKELIPTLAVAVNNSQSFALVIRNVENLKKIAVQKNSIEDTLIEKILKTTEKIQQDKLRHMGDTKWIFGMGGIAFESAVRKLANNIINEEDAEASWKDFEKDTQVFYKAGDLSAEQVEALFELKDTVMELKRISLKENSVGAGVFKDRTVEIVLEKIRDACLEGIDGQGKEILEKLFQADDNKRRQFCDDVDNAIEERVDNTIKQAFNNK